VADRRARSGRRDRRRVGRPRRPRAPGTRRPGVRPDRRRPPLVGALVRRGMRRGLAVALAVILVDWSTGRRRAPAPPPGVHSAERHRPRDQGMRAQATTRTPVAGASSSPTAACESSQRPRKAPDAGSPGRAVTSSTGATTGCPRRGRWLRIGPREQARSSVERSPSDGVLAVRPLEVKSRGLLAADHHAAAEAGASASTSTRAHHGAAIDLSSPRSRLSGRRATFRPCPRSRAHRAPPPPGRPLVGRLPLRGAQVPPRTPHSGQSPAEGW
jgi:hypothetical protein